MFTRWNESDLVEFFGALPKFSEECESYSFTRTFRGVRLDFTLFHLEGAAYVSLSRENEKEPLVTIQRERCSHAQVVKSQAGKVCLEVGSPADEVTDMGIPPLLVRGFRVYLEPDVHIDFIDIEERA